MIISSKTGIIKQMKEKKKGKREKKRGNLQKVITRPFMARFESNRAQNDRKSA